MYDVYVTVIINHEQCCYVLFRVKKKKHEKYISSRSHWLGWITSDFFWTPVVGHRSLWRWPCHAGVWCWNYSVDFFSFHFSSSCSLLHLHRGLVDRSLCMVCTSAHTRMSMYFTYKRCVREPNCKCMAMFRIGSSVWCCSVLDTQHKAAAVHVVRGDGAV